jgi:hypothetical protein
MPSKKQKASHYLAVWDMYGLECLLNIDKLQKEHEDWEKKKIWATLKEENFNDVEPKLPLQFMLLRARTNSQRQYEIYEFNSTLNDEDLKLAFNQQPQVVVDFIRKHGYKIYSDRTEKKQVIV